MNLRSSSEHMPEALLRATRHWDARRVAAAAVPGAPPSHPFTIAISREVGARGTSIARAVGQRLGWQVYDQELVEKIAREMGLRASLLESVDERRQSWLRECLQAFSTAPFVSENGYVRHLLQTLFSLSALGECVIVGRGAALVLPPNMTVRVRLVAALEDRIAVIRNDLGLSRDQAASHIDKVDRERASFIVDHFAKDPSAAQHYDLVLNTSRFSIDDCAELILEALHRLERRAGSAIAASGGRKSPVYSE